MNKYLSFSIGDETYRLRLTSGAIVDVERRLGKPILLALEHLRENMIETLVTILWGSMKSMNQGVTIEKAYDVFDQYIDQGHAVLDMIELIRDILEVSGFFKKGQA